MSMKTNSFILLVALLLSACSNSGNVKTSISGLNPKNFETVINGKQTDLFTLVNHNKMEVCITNFGGRIVSIMVPDKKGVMRDVVLGFDSIQDYAKYETDFGASIGRYANRINKGKVTIEGKDYQLPINNFGHCLHGGPHGFQYQVYDAKQVDDHTLELSYLSKDMEEGFPGNVKCKVIFTLLDNNALDIQYTAETDKTTIVNMTNHAYFNLDGNPTQNNANYLLTVDADYYTPVDSTFMTTGEIASVDNTDFDFRTPTAIGKRINNDSEQLKYGRGYDHNWVLNTKGDINRPCATLASPESGIRLEVYTNEPGIQIYAGNFLDSSLTGKKGITYGHRASVCLETQKYPDTPNKPEWPSALLKPGDTYFSHCIYKFSVTD